MDLLSGEVLSAGERSLSGVGVPEFCLSLKAGLDRAFLRHGGRSHKAVRGFLGHGVGSSPSETIHVQRLSVLERVRGVAGGIKHEVPGLVTVDRPVFTLDGCLERLAGGIGNGDVEREVEIVVVGLVKASRNGDRLGNCECSRLLERDTTVVAKGDVDCPAAPVGVDDGGGSIRIVGILVGTQLVDIGETAGALPQDEISGLISGDCARNTLGNAAGEGGHARRLGGLSVSNVIPGTLVVIRRRAAQRTTSALCALSITVKGRVFGDVVVAVTRRGSECRRRVAIHHPTGVRVREEINLPLLIRVAGNVVRHGLVGIREEVNRLFLKA